MNPGEASFSFFRCLAPPSAPHSVSAGNTGVGHAHPNTMVTSGYLTHCWQWYASLRGAAFLLACILVMHFHATRAPLYYSTRELTNYIVASAPKTTNTTWPSWLLQACPEVTAHFERFPYFSNFTIVFSVMTSEYAAHSVCSLYVAARIAASVGAQLNLHAGSHLGAIIHGGPIPWDDDVDAFLPFEKRDSFVKRCAELRDFGVNGARLECTVAFNAIKFSVVTNSSVKTRYAWMSPFVDIFLFKMDGERIYEVFPDGKPNVQSYLIKDYFPTRPFYFGGVTLIGPREQISLSRYNITRCVARCYHHRLEIFRYCRGMYEIECAPLARFFPFSKDDEITDAQGNRVRISQPLSYNQSVALSLWRTTPESRCEWAREQKKSQGQRLSDQFPNINAVEVDNTISRSCDVSRNSSFKVVEFNAERGTQWHLLAELLSALAPDVIILNEMDIGMARSNQQHTTRLLAFALGMNYAWGIEFIELTRGTSTEQRNTVGSFNFLGLHGNAILSRCALGDAVIFRNPVGHYFDSQPNKVNAGGFERRLGGRMALFARTRFRNVSVVVASVHKVAGHENGMRSYIGRGNAVVAGDQDWGFCGAVGLKHVDIESDATYPASCTSAGTFRGDIICSNGAVVVAESTFLPCVTGPGRIRVALSDHAITTVTLSFSSDVRVR